MPYKTLLKVKNTTSGRGNTCNFCMSGPIETCDMSFLMDSDADKDAFFILITEMNIYGKTFIHFL